MEIFGKKEQSDTDLLKNITLTKMVTPHLHSQLFQWQSCVTIIKLKLRMYQRPLKARKKLYYGFETKAFNQQIIGTTALAYIEKLLPDNDDKLMQVIDKTLNHQSVDGWFEYDGPDLGYLSVSLDGHGIYTMSQK